MVITSLVCFFFFSSRRRHTRSKRDWSSDVCSSDLKDPKPWKVVAFGGAPEVSVAQAASEREAQALLERNQVPSSAFRDRVVVVGRSEERRVGKECRSGWAADA